MKAPPGFDYRRMVPPSWEQRLAQLTPVTEQTTWLKLAWLSGDPWCPVQRWCIYECIPQRLWIGMIQAQAKRGLSDSIEQHILDALQGPPPRTLGHYDTVLQKFVTTADCTQQEWELYRECKAIPSLFWVIQGHHGGHRRHYSPVEQKYLKLAGCSPDPPAPGDLCYAEFDERVLDMVARRQKLQDCKHRLSANDEERGPQMVELRRQLMAWLTDQQREVLESAKLDLSGIPRTRHDPTARIEADVNRFIETGSSTPTEE